MIILHVNVDFVDLYPIQLDIRFVNYLNAIKTGFKLPSALNSPAFGPRGHKSRKVGTSLYLLRVIAPSFKHLVRITDTRRWRWPVFHNEHYFIPQGLHAPMKRPQCLTRFKTGIDGSDCNYLGVK